MQRQQHASAQDTAPDDISTDNRDEVDFDKSENRLTPQLSVEPTFTSRHIPMSDQLTLVPLQQRSLPNGVKNFEQILDISIDCTALRFSSRLIVAGDEIYVDILDCMVFYVFYDKMS